MPPLQKMKLNLPNCIKRITGLWDKPTSQASAVDYTKLFDEDDV